MLRHRRVHRFRPAPGWALAVACLTPGILAGGRATANPAVTPRPGVITPRLEAHRNLDPAAPEIIWVYFSDKGFSTPEEARLAASRLAPRSDRRRRLGIYPDFRDLPVRPDYVEAVRRLGGTIRNTSRWLNAISVAAPANSIDRIAGLGFVEKIDLVNRFRRPDSGRDVGDSYLDPGVEPGEVEPGEVEPGDVEPGRSAFPGMDVNPRSPGAPIEPLTGYPAEEALHYGPSFNQNAQIGIMNLHRQGYTGAGVTICILDTGFRTGHIAFQGRHLIAERDFVFGDNDVDNEPIDSPAAWSHGTSTWSNVGGFKPGAIVGGSFEANILLAKTEDVRSETPVEEDNYIAALEWADTLGADAASASLIYLTFDGGVGDHTYADLNGNTIPLSQAVDIAVSKGMAVVNAMGNSGPAAGTLGTPADADSAISVGAVDSLGTVASFSSRGPTSDGQIKPEVVARGVLNEVASAAGVSTFTHSSGTSFSTPMTAGAVGLLLEAHPEWGGFQVRQALINTASHPGSPDNTTGYGLLNAAAAANQSAKSPPLVSLPFALISPSRGSVSPLAAPVFRWETSLAGAPGDTILYSVVLAANATFAPADTFGAGEDTTWIPPAYLTPGQTYYWTVLAENRAGWVRAAYMPMNFQVSLTAAALPPAAETREPRLAVIGANPFQGSTRLKLTLPPGTGTEPARPWSVDVFEAGGRRVRRLALGDWTAGGTTAEISWDGRDDSGRPLAGGLYFVSLDAGGRRSTLKVTMTR